MKTMNPKIDEYLSGAERWRNELKELRAFLLECPLTEELKWGKPCYTFQSANVVILLALKRSCALLFCKGALLRDAASVLIQPTENTQAARQMRFTSVHEIVERKPTVKAYVREAIAVEKAGLEVAYKQTAEFKVPAEFRDALGRSPALHHAFDSLTPGRQRGYLLYFSAPKQSKTRVSRVEKCRQQILDGRGLHDGVRVVNGS